MSDPDRPRLVADVMSAPLETVSASATVTVAASRMRDQEVSGLFVPGTPPGIVTTTDVRDVVAAGENPDTVTVGDVMTAPVERVRTDTEVGEAAAMMATYGVKHLPVIDEARDYVGMVSSSDVVVQFA
jgi:IMP dehydrogenase